VRVLFGERREIVVACRFVPGFYSFVVAIPDRALVRLSTAVLAVSSGAARDHSGSTT